MDTTAAAELGMRDPNGDAAGASFWQSGPPGSDRLGSPGYAALLDDADEDDLAWDRPALAAAAAAAAAAVPSDIPPASPSGFASARAPAAEPPSKLLRSMPETSLPMHSHGGGASFSGGSSGHGAGPPLSRGHSSAAAAASPHFGSAGAGAAGVGSFPSGAGAVGRGRGMGSIFYKTKLCSRFRSSTCPYNSNCNFAHGMEELRKPPPGWEEFVASQELPPPPPSQSGGPGVSGATAGSTDSQVRFHKTRPCKKYFGEGNCPYGEKCNFLHDEQSAPRAVREAREAAVAASSGGVVAASPRVETPLGPSPTGPLKETGGGGGGGSTSAGSAPPNARLSNRKTRLCNKWETTRHCPFGEKCPFAHGSDEVQRYGGGLSDANAPALSDSKSGGTTSRDSMAVSWQQRHQGGASSSARSGSKADSNWRGPNDISTIYGDWWVEDDYWHRGGSTAGHESVDLEGEGWREAPRRAPRPAPSSSTPKTVPFFRRTNSLEPSR